MEQALTLFAIIWGKCSQLAVRNIYFCCGGHHEWGMGLIRFGSHILEGKGEPELSHRQIERNSKFYTHWLENDSQFPL